MAPLAFPALERAKQRFLKRNADQQQACHRSRSVPEAEPTSSNDARSTAGSVLHAQVAKILKQYTRQLQDDMRVVEQDLIVTHKQVQHEVDTVCQDVDDFTSSLATGTLMPTTRQRTHKQRKVLVNRKRTCHRYRAHRCRSRWPMVPMILTSGTRQQSMPSPRMEPNEAVLRIQRGIRAHLYNRLYAGGVLQFAGACHLRQRTVMLRWWKRWFVFVCLRRRLWKRFLRIQDTLTSEMVHQCKAQADAVLVTDGAFAKAKVYHTLRMKGQALLAWVCIFTQPQ